MLPKRDNWTSNYFKDGSGILSGFCRTPPVPEVLKTNRAQEITLEPNSIITCTKSQPYRCNQYIPSAPPPQRTKTQRVNPGIPFVFGLVCISKLSSRRHNQTHNLLKNDEDVGMRKKNLRNAMHSIT
jgi:hypothetical protein